MDIYTVINVTRPEIDRKNLGLAEPSAGALPVCILADREAERVGCGART